MAESTFKVWGNCGMCEETIETSVKIDGVTEACNKAADLCRKMASEK